MTEQPAAKTLIETEWTWEAATPPIDQTPGGPKIDDWAVFDILVWRGMRLGRVEAFRENGPWYGNSGGRTGPVMSLERCRRDVELLALKNLTEALTVVQEKSS